MRVRLLLLFIIVSSSDIAQPRSYDSLQGIIFQMNKQQVAKDSLINVLIKQSETIKANNEILATALNTNDNIFGGLSTYFTLISILMSIIVIGLPLLNYFFVLKPNRESLVRLEKLETELPKKLESDFGSYLEGFEKRKAKQLIHSLENPANLGVVTNFFFVSDFSDFDDDDQRKVISFLRQYKDIEQIDRTILNSILKSRPSLLAEDYYKCVIQDEDKSDYEFAIKYLIDDDAERNIRFWEIIISASDKGHEILMDIYKQISKKYLGSPFDKKSTDKKNIGEKLVKLFFDNPKICDVLKSKTLSPRYTISGDINENTITWNPFLASTLYIKTYFNNMHRKENDG